MSLWVYHEDGDDYTTYLLSSPNNYYSMFTYERNNGSEYRPEARAAGSGNEGTNQLVNGSWKMLTFVASTSSSSGDTTSSATRTYKWYIDGTHIYTKNNVYACS